ncbi:MAG: FGGY-family carbohydrate kinase, partial [Armatimonadota bacterium]|nr:FGGY-family carbohydrate kinase [Armatimonadota bacterium]
QIREVVACGGLAERNRLLLQLTADITGREVLAAPVPHASAVGAAIYAAAAAGSPAGGYDDVRDAVARMGATERVPYRPRPAEQRTYEVLYREYLDLARHFGEGGSQVMKRLRRLRAEATEGR